MKALPAYGIPLLLLGLSFHTHANDNQLTEHEKQQGWQLLFDGKSMSQWRTYQKRDINPKWQIENDAITLTQGGAGDIITRQQFDDFELMLDWKISEAGNSGIFFLADETGKYVFSHAPEIQIIDNEKHADSKLDTHRSGSLYDMVAAPETAYKPAGEWNTVKISLDDGVLQVWQNGVMTVHIVMHSSTWDKLVAASKFANWQGFAEQSKGHIGLQDHGDKVAFKNIKIRELP